MSNKSASSEDEESAGNGQFGRKKTAVDSQKLRLERLMQNPDKPAHIPDGPKDKPPPPPAEFVRFYMGSSAGAGSGEFHIYRNLRRKEQNRMKFIDDQAKKDKLQSEFDVKLQHNRIIEEQKTAKKRAKRLKKKGKPANKKSKKDLEETKSESESSSTEDGEEDSNSVTTPKEEKALAPTADPPTVPSKHTSDSKTPGISVVSKEKIS